MNIVRKSVEIGGKTITFETGKLAKQASGAVVVSSGESMVLVTGVVAPEGGRPFDFLPLTIDYLDRFGASGAIPGGYLKREGPSTERQTLISRLIDRPIRPLFPKHFRQEVQVIAQVMSFDNDYETDVLALCGAAAALHISEAPISQPTAGVRVCEVDGELVLNPTAAERDRATITLVIAGTRDAITMVEGGANERSEERMLDVFALAQEAIRQICETIDELRTDAGVPKMEIAPAPAASAEIAAYVGEHGPDLLRTALKVEGKHARGDAVKAARNGLIQALSEGKSEEEAASVSAQVKLAWDSLVKKVMRQDVIKTRTRLDGRAPNKIRAIWSEVGMAPRAHGSAVFTRGETQGFVTAALGTEDDNQRIEEPSGHQTRRWMLTYNFQPYCTGEARPLRGPKRREVGHGALARRAIEAVLPDPKEFPYALRCTSEITESNGSSSMATICGSSLALMDAGVPLKGAVAGIAMGLIKEGDEFVVISDILGDEDALGDMDFKVAGTRNGITAFQMDVKIGGLSSEIMAAAMAQAKEGRLHILDEMAKVLAEPRSELSKYAPRITTLHIKTDRIRDLIGPGGKIIRGIQEACGVKVSVDDSGRVDVASSDQNKTDKAIAMIREITQEAEIGALYVGVVKRIVDFGAFVEIFPGTDGLVHISELAKERVERVTDVLHEGDEVLVRVIDIDRAGKIRLSRKDALEGGR